MEHTEYGNEVSVLIPPDVDVHHFVILGQARRLDASHCQDAGAVHQHVQTAEVGDGLLHGFLDGLFVGQISRHKQRLVNQTRCVSLKGTCYAGVHKILLTCT